MSDDLLKWFAYAQHHSHEETARLLMTQATEIARLRSVCRLAVWHLTDLLPLMDNSSRLVIHVQALIDDLADAGKEPSDG